MKKVWMFAGQGAAVSNRRGRFGNRPSLFAALVCLLVGCESSRYYVPPAVTSQMTKDNARQHVDPSAPLRTSLATLQKGRALFARRCIECHTLPPVWHYRVEDWPAIVNSMAHRASLKPAEREAIVTYILAVRVH